MDPSSLPPGSYIKPQETQSSKNRCEISQLKNEHVITLRNKTGEIAFEIRITNQSEGYVTAIRNNVCALLVGDKDFKDLKLNQIKEEINKMHIKTTVRVKKFSQPLFSLRNKKFGSHKEVSPIKRPGKEKLEDTALDLMHRICNFQALQAMQGQPDKIKELFTSFNTFYRFMPHKSECKTLLNTLEEGHRLKLYQYAQEYNCTALLDLLNSGMRLHYGEEGESEEGVSSRRQSLSQDVNEREKSSAPFHFITDDDYPNTNFVVEYEPEEEVGAEFVDDESERVVTLLEGTPLRGIEEGGESEESEESAFLRDVGAEFVESERVAPLLEGTPLRDVRESAEEIEKEKANRCPLTNNQSTSSGLAHVITVHSMDGAIFEIRVDANLKRDENDKNPKSAENIAQIIQDRIFKLVKDRLILTEDLIMQEIRNSAGVPNTKSNPESIQVINKSPHPFDLSPTQEEEAQETSPIHTLKIIYFGIENQIHNEEEMHQFFDSLENNLKNLPKQHLKDFPKQWPDLVKFLLDQSPDTQERFAQFAQHHLGENWDKSVLCHLITESSEAREKLNFFLEKISEICTKCIQPKKYLSARPLFRALEPALKSLQQDGWPSLNEYGPDFMKIISDLSKMRKKKTLYALQNSM